MQMEREQKDTEQFALEEEKREIEWQKNMQESSQK